MEQTVTLVRSQGNNYNLFGSCSSDEFATMQEHVAQMTQQGWPLITTEMANQTSTPTMLFWRRE
ncbi:MULTISPECIES: hypothetical protein [unclassified Rathayibacter]|uniref:hypothetical protein n=1 Tax=unclassified Rathayibacter TaxID=2609250 RepID=UPI000CE7FFBA|nr:MULTISPECIES: hypothetical protein [unclassified Rathayibacter]PPF25757.1 hypothetical protein C5C54_14750 [Rathayibacter sp. AY1F2]PPH43702.1 hypothetical protein C5C42_13480 [Rathayibacter sp. AY1F7]